MGFRPYVVATDYNFLYLTFMSNKNIFDKIQLKLFCLKLYPSAFGWAKGLKLTLSFFSQSVRLIRKPALRFLRLIRALYKFTL
ncbi:MAG: hypothetical protein P1P59_09740 [Treponemataceae bacterium]